MPRTPASTALAHLRILDLSRVRAGPTCVRQFADFGADVIRIESPPGLDPNEGMGGARSGSDFQNLQRNKRAMTLNLKLPAAREVFGRLVQTADVVVENYRPDVKFRLGIDYETLAKINPRIITCSLSGFGQTGPYSNLVGHDINYISIGGALGVTGRPGTPPAIPVNLIADFAGGGMHAALAICLAIIARERTGRGQDIDISMSDGVLSLMTSAFTGYFSNGQPIRPGQFLLNGAVPWYNTYLCSDDRWFSIGSIEPHFYANLCRVLGVEEYLERQFDEAAYPEMKAKYEAIFRTKTADEWMELMSQYDICAAPVLEMENVVKDPHNLARGMVIEVDSPIGPVKQIGVGAKLSDTPGKVRGTSPLIGQHTGEILAALGYDEAKIATLREAGVVG